MVGFWKYIHSSPSMISRTLPADTIPSYPCHPMREAKLRTESRWTSNPTMSLKPGAVSHDSCVQSMNGQTRSRSGRSSGCAGIGMTDHRAELRSDQLFTIGLYSFSLTTLGSPSRLSDNHAAYHYDNGRTETARGPTPRRQKTQTSTGMRYMSAEERSATHQH